VSGGDGSAIDGVVILVVRFVVLETGFKLSSESESESDSDPDVRRSVGLFRSASGRDGIAVDGCVVWIVRVVGSDTECESSSESELETESFASESNGFIWRANSSTCTAFQCIDALNSVRMDELLPLLAP
jgi:hypothetical protein